MDLELARQHLGRRQPPRSRPHGRTGGGTAGCCGTSISCSAACAAASARRSRWPSWPTAYDGADGWARDLLDDAEPDDAPVSEPGTITDAAFHHYARGALDYRP